MYRPLIVFLITGVLALSTLEDHTTLISTILQIRDLNTLQARGLQEISISLQRRGSRQEKTPSPPKGSSPTQQNTKSPSRKQSTPVSKDTTERSRSLSRSKSPPTSKAQGASNTDSAKRQASQPIASSSRQSPKKGAEDSTFNLSRLTIQGHTVRESAGGAVGHSRSPSPARTRSPPDPVFKEWFAMNQDAIQQSREGRTTSVKTTNEGLKNIFHTKVAARRARSEANKDLDEASRIKETRRASSPTTKDAVLKSLSSANRASMAGAKSTFAWSQAAVDYSNTDRHHLVEGFLKSGAKELIRNQARVSHMRAFQDEHHARLALETATTKKQDDPERGAAYGQAARAKKESAKTAARYYRHYDEYRYTKEQLSGGESSSSDEERPLKDAPRKNAP